MASPPPDAARKGAKRVAATSRASSAYPRKRAITACQVCRSRRTKCDQKKPACTFCAKIGAECVFQPTDLSTFDPASLAIIDRLERLEQKLDVSISLNAPRDSDQPAAAAAEKAAHAAATCSLSPVAHTPAVVISPSPAQCPCPCPSSTSPITIRFPQNLESVLEWGVFRDLGCPVTLPSSSPSSLSTSLGGGSGSSSSSSSRTTLVVARTSDELDPVNCKAWLDSFFSHVHVKNPVFNEDNTRRLVRRVCLEGAGWDAQSCLALLICANGALVRPFDGPSLLLDELPGSEAMALFRAAQKRLGPVLLSTGVVEAQCAFLTGVFLMSVHRMEDAWRMFLQGLAICQSFHSIRSPETVAAAGGLKPDLVVAEESVHWSCWKSEREVRVELNYSSLGHLGHDLPQQFPSPPAAHENDGQQERAWYFYLSEISLWRLEAKTKQEMTALANRVDDQRRRLLDDLSDICEGTLEQVQAFRTSMPASVSIAEQDVSALRHDDVLRYVLRGRIVHIGELITWPFILAVLRKDADSEIVRRWATKGLAFHAERLVVYRSGYYHRHHGTWLMACSTARSTCILLAFANMPSVSDLLPPGWREAVDAAVKMLQYWRDEAPGIGKSADVARHLMFKLDGY